MGEEGARADLHAGRDCTSEVLALLGDAVERGRRAEVYDDGSALDALVRSDRIDDTVGTDLSWVLVQHGHAGLDSRTDDHDLVIEGSIDGLYDDVVERGHDGGQDAGSYIAALNPGQRQQVEEEDVVFITRPTFGGLDSKVVNEAFAVIEAKYRVGIADVYDEEHLARP